MSAVRAGSRDSARRPGPRRSTRLVWLVPAAALLLIAPSSPALAASAPVGLGTTASYSVLGGQTVTNTGPTTLSGDLGVSPGSAITGFPPGTVGGAKHAADAPAGKAQSDLVIAYNDAAGRPPSALVAGDLVGRTLTAGVFKSTSSLALSGTVTLDGQGNANSVFIFQIASTLVTASASTVKVVNGAQACNIFWQVGSSATLGTTSSFQGTVLALTSIAVTTGVVVKGRALARNGSVTLDNDTFTSPACASTTTTTTSAGGGGGAGGATTTIAGSGLSGGGSGSGSGTGSGIPVTGASPLLGLVAAGGALLLVVGVLLAAGRFRGRRIRLP